MTTSFFKLLAWLLIVIPIVFATVFGLLQIFSGDILGLENLVLIVPLAVVALIARTKPFVAGSILIIVSLSLAITYPFSVPSMKPTVSLLTELFFFGPPLVSGLIFLLLNRDSR